MRKFIIIVGALVLALGLAYALIIKQTTMPELILKSSAFKEGEIIPVKFTCDGENISPLLEIRNIPEKTQSLALIVDDPDATGGQTWVHWLLWNIPPKTQYISEDSVPLGAVAGTTSFGSAKYGGPCPPRGNPPHRYMFKLYALDSVLNLTASSTKTDLERAMNNHIVGQTVLIGRYSRSGQ